MADKNVLKKIKGIQLTKPTEQVVNQLRDLIVANEIGPGDMLPSENELAKSFGVGKGYVREAIKRLEMYGIVKPIPGVGTIVSDLGKGCVNEFISNLVQFSVHDYRELVEVRALIEPFTAYRAAINATEEELSAIGELLRELERLVAGNEINLQLECSFHLEIAKASHNGILANTMNAILPGLVELVGELDMLKDNRHEIAHAEHAALYDALVRRDPNAAEQAMVHHMRETGAHFSVRVVDIEKKRASQRMYRK